MPFTIVRQDITRMQVDAIVNAANTELLMGGGVCGAIFQAAGPEELQEACDRFSPIRTGQAVITPGFRLPAKYVIHAVGPIYSHYPPEEAAALLRSAYTQALALATENGCESVAFPLISSGIYGYPKAEALQVATQAITGYLEDHELNVYLAVFGRQPFAATEELMGQVARYIDRRYVDTFQVGAPLMGAAPEESERSSRRLSAPAYSAAPKAARKPRPWERWQKRAQEAEKKSALEEAAPPPPTAPAESLEEALGNLDEPFSEALFRLIDSRGKTDAEVYKRANIDRKLFSKIRSVPGYTPKKPTILALAVSLELTLGETESLLRRAGYALSTASKFDVIVEYFIVSGRYNIFEINEVLFQYDQPLLGS